MGLKLLVVSPTSKFGGTEKCALTVATAARSRGWEVHVLSHAARATAEYCRDLAAKGLATHVLGGGDVVDRRTGARAQMLRALKVLLRVRPDAVHLNVPWPDRCFGIIYACALRNVPTVVTYHCVPGAFVVGRRRLKGYAWARLRRQRWTAVSDHARRLMCQSLGIPPEEVRRIYNGVPQPPAESNGADAAALVERDQAEVRRELGLAPDARILLSVGRLVPPKGLDRVIKAAPHLLSEFPDVRFVWAGDGLARDALAAQAREYGVADRIVFAGQRSDVPRFLRAADLFVFPSLFEAFGLALAEAMAYGVPVVASDAGGIPELVTHREHGLICRTGDSAALLEALRWALRNPDEMKRMAANARCRAAQFPEQRMIDETLGLLEETARLPR